MSLVSESTAGNQGEITQVTQNETPKVNIKLSPEATKIAIIVGVALAVLLIIGLTVGLAYKGGWGQALHDLGKSLAPAVHAGHVTVNNVTPVLHNAGQWFVQNSAALTTLGIGVGSFAVGVSAVAIYKAIKDRQENTVINPLDDEEAQRLIDNKQKKQPYGESDSEETPLPAPQSEKKDEPKPGNAPPRPTSEPPNHPTATTPTNDPPDRPKLDEKVDNLPDPASNPQNAQTQQKRSPTSILNLLAPPPDSGFDD